MTIRGFFEARQGIVAPSSIDALARATFGAPRPTPRPGEWKAHKRLSSDRLKKAISP